MSDKPLVAIHCLVYNHGPFLRDCFEGFVMQQTNFSYVAIVHDDASTDNSVAIIREYEAKYPHIFKPIYEGSNIYSVGGFDAVNQIMNRAIDATGAKYIAVCEGDDYWTDPLKLQKQVDFMKANSDYSMCFHAAEIINTTNYFSALKCTNIENREYTATEVFSQWTVPTASILYDKVKVDSFTIKHPEWILFGDIILVEKCCHVGKIFGLSDKMSVYRMQGESVSHNARFSLSKIQRSPNFFRCIKINFHNIDKDAVNWCISHAYYSRARNLKQNILYKLRDIILSLYWHPQIIIGKLTKKTK